MTNDREALRPALGVVQGLAAIVALAILWHLLGYAAPPAQEGYPLTQYLTSCISWPFVTLFALISLGLGWMNMSTWSVAVGMILPFPFALVVELAQDPTSHNLFPFEIIIYWTPAFVVAYGAGRLGKLLRIRLTRVAA